MCLKLLYTCQHTLFSINVCGYFNSERLLINNYNYPDFDLIMFGGKSFLKKHKRKTK